MTEVHAAYNGEEKKPSQEPLEQAKPPVSKEREQAELKEPVPASLSKDVSKVEKQ